jgi:uncharacterized protein (TIGR03067 family)
MPIVPGDPAVNHSCATLRRAIVALTLAIGGAVALAAGCGGPSTSSPPTGPSTSVPEDDATKFERERLQGRWVMIDSERDGKKLEPGGSQRVVFEGNTMTWKDSSHSFAKTFRLDPQPTPKQIDFTSISEETKGLRGYGIYELDGDRLKLCMNSKDRPTSSRRRRGRTGCSGS